MAYPWMQTGVPDLSGMAPIAKPEFLRKRGLLESLFSPGDTSGLFDQETTGRAGKMGLLNAGLSLLASGGKQPHWGRPNLGQALQQGLQAGQQGYDQVLQGASQLGNMRAQQAADQKAQQTEAATKALYSKYSQRIAAGDPKAAGEMMLEATSLGIPTGPISQLVQAYAGMQDAPKEPKYVQVEGVDAQGRPTAQWTTAEEAAKMGPQRQYVRPMGGGGGGLSPAGQVGADRWIAGGFDRDVAPDMEIINRYDLLNESAQQFGASGPVQVAALFSFITQLDDTAVRDGERDLVAKAASIKDRFKALEKTAKGGQVAIPPDMYRDITDFLRVGRQRAAVRANQKAEKWQERAMRVPGMTDPEGLTQLPGSVRWGDVEGIGRREKSPYD
jgi:hypothetical protein